MKKLLSFLTALVLCVTSFCSSAAFRKVEAAEPIKFYVSPTGSDAWSGTLAQANDLKTDGPFQTVEAARDAIRALKQANGGILAAPVIVYLRGGTYFLDETLEFLPQDSGTEACPITYQAYPGESPVLSGGKELQGTWSQSSHTTPTGVTVYEMDVPEAADNAWNFRSLFMDEERQIWARYPNKIENDVLGESYLYVYEDINQILAGLALKGDFAEYTLEVPAGYEGTYDFWFSATSGDTEQRISYYEIRIDGQLVTFDEGATLKPTAGWRMSHYNKLTTDLKLTAGTHTLRIDNIATGDEQRVHMDAFLFTTNKDFPEHATELPNPEAGEKRIVIQAENDALRTDGYSSFGFQKFESTPAAVDNNTIHIRPEHIKATWAGDPQAFINIVVDLHYMNERVQIESIDMDEGIIKLIPGTDPSSEAVNPIRPYNYFFIEGVKEELDAVGEWYLDGVAGKLYFAPEQGENADSLNAKTFVAPYLHEIVKLNGDDGSATSGTERVQWLAFQGIEFRHAQDTTNHKYTRTPTDGAIKLVNACNNTFDGCKISNVDGMAMWLHLDSCDNIIQNCTMEKMGAGGILMTTATLNYGDNYDPRTAVKDFAPLRNIITRNVITDGNKVRFNGAGVLLDSRLPSTALKAGNMITYNEISYLNRQGIFGFQNQSGNIVAYNHLHHLMMETADGGAINFAPLNAVTAPSLFKNNLIHDVVGLKRAGKGQPGYFGGMGIYTDHGASHTTAINNIVYNTGHASYFSNSGQRVLLQNNIFADDRASLFAHSEHSMDSGRDTQLINNILASTQNSIKQIDYSAWGVPNARITQIVQTMRTNPRHYFKNDLNLYYNAGNPIRVTGAESFDDYRRDTLQDIGSLVLDPQFKAASQHYELEDTSPAYSLGFQKFALVPDGATPNVGPKAVGPDDPTLTFDIVTPKVVTQLLGEATVTDGQIAVFNPEIPEDGNYLVYVDRSGKTPVDTTIRSAGGLTSFALSDMIDPDSVQEMPVFVGIYNFKAGKDSSITFKQTSTSEANLPKRILLIKTGMIDETVKGLKSYLNDVTICADNTTLQLNETAQLSVFGTAATGEPVDLTGATVKYESANEQIVTVDSVSGIMTAVGNGKTTVTAKVTKDGVLVLSLPLLVECGVYVEKAVLNADQFMLQIGDQAQLSVSAKMSDGTDADLSKAIIRYASNDETIATVDSQGKVTAIADGNATFTATVIVNGAEISTLGLTMRIGDYNLVLHYDFDESDSGTETLLDHGEGPKADAEFFGGATRTGETPGEKGGGALALPETGIGHVSPGVDASAKLNGLTEFTYTQWVKLLGPTALYDRFFSKGLTLELIARQSTSAEATSLYIAVNNVPTNFPSLDLTEWTFLAITSDGTTVQVFVGGESGELTPIVSVPAALSWNSADEFRIGSTPLSPSDRTPYALMDDVRIYDTALPALQLPLIRDENVRKETTETNTAPVITAEDKVLTVGDEFDEKAGVTATDAEDGDLTAKIVVTENTVNTKTVGDYKVTYQVTDSKGLSDTKTITVKVKAAVEPQNTAPVITAEDKVLTVGDEFDEKAGVTATDAEDGDLTDQIVITENTVNTKAVGKYKVTYQVTDSKGVNAIRTIWVTVEEEETGSQNPPVPSDPDVDSPPTGGSIPFTLLFGLLLASGGMIAVIAYQKKKADKAE